MSSPLVSVICLCHNQSEYVAEAIQSVWDQDYPNIELIVVDDGSNDSSVQKIEEKLQGTSTKFIPIEPNIGNCKAFNKGFHESSGSYIIDLAADDLLMPNRVSAGVRDLHETNLGVNFCDVMLLDESGKKLGSHYDRDPGGKLKQHVPEGDVYLDLITTYFISPPSMMIRREVLEELNGYDESLAYEDFDFWIRSSRNWHYGFTDEILVEKRMLKDSHAVSQFKFRTKHQQTTLAVCKKIKELNQTSAEQKALRSRCWYEIRQCIRQGNLGLIPGFLKLL